MIDIGDLISFASPIFSALIIWYFQVQAKKRDEETKERAEARKAESYLFLEQLYSIGKLTYANSVAIKEGKVNGVMEDAMISYKSSKEKMLTFMREQSSDNIWCP